MKIVDILSPQAVKVPLVGSTRREVIDELIDLLHEGQLIRDPETLKRVVWERECQRSTGIGEGLAIPHGKSSCSESIVMAIGRAAQPIDFAAIDGRPVKLVVLLTSPPEKTSDHIQALGHLSRLMARPQVRKAAYKAESAEALYEIFRNAE